MTVGLVTGANDSQRQRAAAETQEPSSAEAPADQF